MRREYLSLIAANWEARGACERAFASARQERRYGVALPTYEVWRVSVRMPHGPDGPCIAPVLHAGQDAKDAGGRVAPAILPDHAAQGGRRVIQF